MKLSLLRRSGAVMLLAGLLIAACRPSAPNLTETPVVDGTPTATRLPPTPTSSPTPLPPRALLVVDESSPYTGATLLEETMLRLAGEAGLEFQRLGALTPAEVTSEVKLVVITPPGIGAAELASAAPQTQFVAIAIPGLSPTANLSLIGPDGERPDLQGFLAGYIAAVVTQDWRVGIIGPGDAMPGRAVARAAVAGVEYFCGLCNPPFPPFDYPLLAEVPAASPAADWQAAAASMIALDKDVRTVVLAPGAGDAALIDYLSQAGVSIVGLQPPGNAPRERWVATVLADASAALETLWPGLLAGTGGQTLPIPIRYLDANPNIFTPGRQLLVDNMFRELDGGFIDPGVDPLTGEPEN